MRISIFQRSSLTPEVVEAVIKLSTLIASKAIKEAISEAKLKGTTSDLISLNQAAGNLSKYYALQLNPALCLHIANLGGDHAAYKATDEIKRIDPESEISELEKVFQRPTEKNKHLRTRYLRILVEHLINRVNEGDREVAKFLNDLGNEILRHPMYDKVIQHIYGDSGMDKIVKDEIRENPNTLIFMPILINYSILFLTLAIQSTPEQFENDLSNTLINIDPGTALELLKDALYIAEYGMGSTGAYEAVESLEQITSFDGNTFCFDFDSTLHPNNRHCPELS